MIRKYGSLALILSRFKWEAIASIVPADIQTDGGGGTLVIAPSEICQKREGQNPERGIRNAASIVLQSLNGRSQYCSPSKKAGKIANIMRSVSLLAWDSTHFEYKNVKNSFVHGFMADR